VPAGRFLGIAAFQERFGTGDALSPKNERIDPVEGPPFVVMTLRNCKNELITAHP